MTTVVVILAGLCAAWLLEAALVFTHLGQLEDLARQQSASARSVAACERRGAARDEAAGIAHSLESRLADGYPDLEVIVVDDRSADDTPRLIAELAARDPRVRPLRVDETPPGWLGKVHALDVGVRAATGAWLLFSDADVEVAPGALSRAVAHCEARGLDLLALAPAFRSTSGLVDVAWAILLRVVAIALSPKAVRDPGSKAAYGQRRLHARCAAARSTGRRGSSICGWRQRTMSALGVMVKRAGGRCDFLNGRGAATVSIYDDLSGLFRGVEKNGASLGGLPFFAVAAACRAVRLRRVLSVRGHRPRALERARVARVGGMGERRSGDGVDGRRTAPQHPGCCGPRYFGLSGWGLTAAAVLRSSWLVHARDGVTWRGDFSSREELLEARHRRTG